MRLITLVNFRRDGMAAAPVIASNNDFTCQFNRPITIKKGSKVVLIHAEINHVVAVEDTSDSSTTIGTLVNDAGPVVTQTYTNVVNQERTTKPQVLCFIDIPSLPVQSFTAQANGGKGRETHIVGVARTNDTDAVFSTDINVDLHNAHDIVLTELQVRLLDNLGDLFTFTGTHRQVITIGIKDACECK